MNEYGSREALYETRYFLFGKKKKKGISKMEIIKKKKKRALLNALTTIPTIPTACRNLNREVKKTLGH